MVPWGLKLQAYGTGFTIERPASHDKTMLRVVQGSFENLILYRLLIGATRTQYSTVCELRVFQRCENYLTHLTPQLRMCVAGVGIICLDNGMPHIQIII